ncbi:MAG: hypothetical protein OXK79_02300 [Chloroflexota bacterium]|nr:hypothetical protein [Chloroflexota bacterium]
MPTPSIATAEDWGNASDVQSTFRGRSVDRARAVDEQAQSVVAKEALRAPAIAFPRTGNGDALTQITERRQTRSARVSVRDWPEAPDDLPRTVTFYARQEWEGHVVAINATEFTARLVDLTAGGAYEEEEAVIPVEEISDSDAARLKVGSIFRWVIGYKRSALGQKERTSSIVFRDLPAMSRSDEQAGRAWAARIQAAFAE